MLCVTFCRMLMAIMSGAASSGNVEGRDLFDGEVASLVANIGEELMRGVGLG